MYQSDQYRINIQAKFSIKLQNRITLIRVNATLTRLWERNA